MCKYAIGCDHNGVYLKDYIIKKYSNQLHDFGVYNSNIKSNYPDIAFEVGKSIANNVFQKGILICGTGIGMSIAANKIKGIRAAVISDISSAKFSRLHNDINILCIGEKIISYYLALNIIDIFLNTNFEQGRHISRINIINNFEKESEKIKNEKN